MSQEQKLTDLIRESFQKLSDMQELLGKELEAIKQKQSSTISEPKKEGHKSVKEEMDCPECYKERRPYFYAKENFKDKKYQCEDCGVPVSEDEEECPSCRGKNARPKHSK